MVSKIESDRYANTGFSIADTPLELNNHLFRKMMEKSGAERMAIACKMNETARALVWSGIPQGLPASDRRQLFLKRFYGKSLSTTHPD
jgi:hypothetical protein